MDENKSISSLFSNHLAMTFMLALLAITAAGLMFVDGETEQGGLFIPGAGLTFEGIVQVFIWACIISGLIVLLTSDKWFAKIMLLWRMAVLLLLGSAVTAGFVIAFEWFPIESREAWVIFLVIFALAFGGSLFGMIAKTKIEDKRVNKLLNDYKSRKGDSE